MGTAETEIKSAKIEALSFLVAFLIILLCAASTIWLFRLLKAPDLLAAAAGSSYFAAIKYLHERLEAHWHRPSAGSQTPIRLYGPTVQIGRMFLYSPLVVFGIYDGTLLLSAGMGGVGAFLTSVLKLPLIPTMIAVFALTLLLGLCIPVFMYLTGEWIGRRTGRQAIAVVVSVSSALFAAAVTTVAFHYFYWPTVAAAIPAIKDNLGIVRNIWLVVMLLSFISMSIPISVGAYRGCKYKAFYDLAYYSKRLDKTKRTEIDDFVTLMSTEYFADIRHINDGLETTSSASA